MVQKKRVIAIIQARKGSARFPGKIWHTLADRFMVLHSIRAADSTPSVCHTYIAMPGVDRRNSEEGNFVPANSPLVTWYYHPGDENDVLGRFIAILKKDPADIVVRLTADNPCVKPCQIEKLIQLYLDQGDKEEPDLISDLYVEVVPSDGLRETWELTQECRRGTDCFECNAYREHVTMAMTDPYDEMSVNHQAKEYPWWSVDYEEDLSRMENILAGRCTITGGCDGADWAGPGCRYIRDRLGH